MSCAACTNQEVIARDDLDQQKNTKTHFCSRQLCVFYVSHGNCAHDTVSIKTKSEVLSVPEKFAKNMCARGGMFYR